MGSDKLRFAYENLSDDQFEKLVVLICQRLLGTGVQGFAKGADGGRDARFTGTAELHPSTASPWTGTTIIQAKHTNGHNKHFSESDFYSAESATCYLAKEVPRISNLKQSRELDNYILFANRRLSANADTEIRRMLESSCGVPFGQSGLFGLEQLEILLSRFPQIVQEAELDPIDAPLIVDPNDLADVVEALAAGLETTKALDEMPARRTSLAKKNELNGMSDAYAKLLRMRYLKDARSIEQFLAAPENVELQELYENATEEFNLKITSKRKDYQSFDEIMEYLADLLFDRNPILRKRGHKRLTRAVLFYMYWNCDIGEVEDAATV